MLAFDHADLGYGRRRILTDLNLVLNEGDFLGIVGPNGTGKDDDSQGDARNPEADGRASPPEPVGSLRLCPAAAVHG